MVAFYDAVVSPSSQIANQYSGGGIGELDSESRHLRDITKFMVPLCTQIGLNVLFLWSTDLATRVRQSNAVDTNLHLAAHSNAGGGSGAGTYIYKRGTKSEIMAREIQATLSALTPFADDGVIVMNHYETRETKAFACIAEISFHDNVSEAEWIRTHKPELAAALVRGMAKALAAAYGGKYVEIAARPFGEAPKPAPTPTPVPVPPASTGTPTPTPIKAKNPRAHRTYAPGEVKRIQEILKNLSYYKGDLDDDYGDWTHDAVEAYQKGQLFVDLLPDGDWGPSTEAHYQWVLLLQTKMNLWRGSDIRVDGDYLQLTKNRVHEIMVRNHKVAYNGFIDDVPGPTFCKMLGIPTHP